MRTALRITLLSDDYESLKHIGRRFSKFQCLTVEEKVHRKT
jgi:hypothetical protein